jgi:hypothetical protein
MTVTKALAAELGARTISHTVVTDGAGRTDSIDAVSLEDIGVGHTHFQHLPAAVISAEIFGCWDADGLAGSNLLRGSIVQILPDRHLIIVTDDIDRLPVRAKGGIPMNAHVDHQSYAHINVVFKGRTNVNVDLGFDSGADEFISMPSDYLRQLAPYGVYDVVDRGFGADVVSAFGLGVADSIYRVRIPALRVGDARFDHVLIETHPENNGRIGAQLLNYGSVTLDFIHGQFYFNATQRKNDLYAPKWPVNPTVRDGRLWVGVVWSAMKDSVKPGEQIVALGDTPTTATSLCTWVAHNLLATSSTVVLKVKGADGAVRDVSMTKE